jgi:hypothetical protein
MTDDRVDSLARSIAAFELPHASEGESTAVSAAEWRVLLSRILAERMTGLALESALSGILALNEGQMATLYERHRMAMAWVLHVERKIVALHEAFDDEGIEFAVLKGASVANSVYDDPSLRSFSDLDVLVSPAGYERACALLRRLGHARRQPEPRPGFDVRFGRASVHKHPQDGVEVDLHRTPGWGPFGQWIDVEELLDRRESFMLAGRKIGRLDDTGMLLNVAMHASLGGWPERQLVPLRDVAQVMTRGNVEWDTMMRWATDWHVAAVMKHGLLTASATLGAPTPKAASCLVELQPPRGEKRTLDACIGDRRERGGPALATLRAIDGVRPRMAYVWALAAPSREFLAAREGPGRAAYLRRWHAPLRWAKARIAGRRRLQHRTRIGSG